MVPCSRIIWITKSSDHSRVWTANLLHMKQLSSTKIRLPVTQLPNKSRVRYYRKNRYIVHYRNLQLYWQLAMRLKKNWVLTLQKFQWLKSYINFNTEKRKKASNFFEEVFFELTNNSVYDKTMENVWIRLDVRLVKNAKDYQISASKPSFNSQMIFNENW